MALEALSSNEFLNFIIYDTISATPCRSQQESLDTNINASFSLENNSLIRPQEDLAGDLNCTSRPLMTQQQRRSAVDSRKQDLAVQGKKKRRRKPRVCKNKEEAETQRRTHIAVERNRRKQMNEHLSLLRSLMPESYVQRGDQASVVGGAIEYVKELEHLLQSLEAQKLQLLQNGVKGLSEDTMSISSGFPPAPFSQFLVDPQYTLSQLPNKLTSKTKAAMADIEVTVIETHANLRILTRKSPRQLSKLVAGFQSLHLSVLHLNVTTIHPLVLYSISAKVEEGEGCQVRTVDDISGAVHHMLRIIEEASNVDLSGLLN